MPHPMMFIVAVLLGWPLVQIASVLLVRGRRSEMRKLMAELRSDRRYDQSDMALLDRAVADAQGSTAFVVAPIALPLAILGAGLAEFFGRNRPSTAVDEELRKNSRLVRAAEIERGVRTGREAIDHDPRFTALQHLAFEIGFLRWPVTAALTMITCLPVLPVFLLAYGVRETLAVVPRATLVLARSLRLTTLDLQSTFSR